MKRDDLLAVWNRKREVLAEQVRACLTSGSPAEVNLSAPRHSAIAPVLRRFAYDRAFDGRAIPVVFGDTSRPSPFPLGGLGPDGTPPGTGDVVKLGLKSFRHPGLELIIDLYFTRNRDLNDEPSMAGAEAISYATAVEMLSDPALDGGGQIWVFHTGLEPMVVGFYRGVAEVLRRRRRQRLARTLVVTPWLYAPDRAKPPDDPLASAATQLEQYVRETAWW